MKSYSYNWDYPNIQSPEQYLKVCMKELSWCDRINDGITQKVAARGTLAWIWGDYWHQSVRNLARKLGINENTLHDNKRAVEKVRTECMKFREATSKIRDQYM